MTKLFVAGAGSWGTALAVLLAGHGRDVTLWARSRTAADRLRRERTNEARLPGILFPERLDPVHRLDDLADHDGMLLVVPAQAAREHLERFRDAVDGAPMRVALCCKGLERTTIAPMHHVLTEVWPEARPAVLSGPSFAMDVAQGLPTAVTLAAASEPDRAFWLEALATPTFRPYASPDLLGAELGGAIKNVLAIACGIAEGKGFGDSARAALIARGFAEMQRFGTTLGASAETLSGLSGLGDLVLTCGSRQSRNFSLGMALGRGGDAEALLQTSESVAEGAQTAKPLVEQARSLGVEMPICEGVASLLDKQTDVDSLVGALMTRPLTTENPKETREVKAKTKAKKRFKKPAFKA